ncbi:MAG: hypothetical protein KY463_14235, partial [Actinobacteria bacterium]|nr:hypothetical protein [Actinomycetota bacterium]
VAERYHPRFTPALRDVRRVRAPARLAVTIDLRRPSLGFDDQPLADLPILPRHRWQQLPAGRLAPRGLPLGSGPSRLVRAQPARGYAFRANRGYFLGVPRVREIRVPIIRDAQRTYEALRRRRVDMVPLGLPPAAASEFASMLGIALRRGPSYTGTALFFNLRRPPFDRVAARRAVAAALDLGRIARNVAPAVAADEGFIHPESRWSPRRRLHRFAPRSASAAGATLGPSVVRVLAPANDPVRVEAGRQVVLALRRAGARATLMRRPREQFERALGIDGSTPDFEAAIMGTPPLVSYDPGYLTRLFGADPRTAPLNVGGYRSEQFEALARRVASAPDPQARRRATLAELELIGRDVPAVALFFPRGTYAFRPAIYDGWVFVKGTGILDKRSFTPRATPAGAQPEGPAAGARPPDSASGWSPDLLDVISLAVLAVVVALAATALLLRRRDRRARGF